METSLHTLFNFLAKRFLRWLCLPMVNPARRLRRAWLGSDDSPQTHLVASVFGGKVLAIRMMIIFNQHCPPKFTHNLTIHELDNQLRRLSN